MKEVKLQNVTAYEYEDIAFANTNLFLETRKHYLDHGCYTRAHPASTEFKQFWDREENRLLNGMTIPGKLITRDDGSVGMQDVKITGEHYGYLNYGRIKLTKDDDVIFGEGAEQILKDSNYTNAKNNGRIRVGTKTIAFPDFWDGDYHYFKAKDLARSLGLHLCVSKARRKGYTYKNSYIGAHQVTMIPYITVIFGAFEEKYLLSADSITTFAKGYLDWFQTETDFTRHYITEAIKDIELGYMLPGTRIKRGYKSKLLTLTFKDNPNAAVGKDAFTIFLEEAGVFPNLDMTLGVTLPTLEDGDYVTGQMVVFGTGGTKDANWAAFESLFYDPILNGFMPFHNVFDEESRGTTCGFFHGYDLNYVPYIDKNGNSDREAAKERILEVRHKKQKSTTNQSKYITWIGQRCLNPAEAFSSSKVSIYDSPELRTHIQAVKVNPKFKYLHRTGIIREFKGNWHLVTDDELAPHERHPFLNKRFIGEYGDLHGTFTEWYPPFNVGGVVPSNMYRIWVDPYAFRKDKDDITIHDSLGAAYVYERANSKSNSGGDRLIACYVGRPEDYDDFNEAVRRMALYYNALVQFENDRGTIEDYFAFKKCHHLLADEPKFNWSIELQGKNTTRKKGTSIAQGSDRKGKAAVMLKQWLYTKRTKFDSGEPVYNFHYIYDLGLLQELQRWNFKGNFDRVSALLVGMLDKTELLEVEIEQLENQARDSFFERELF